MPMSSVDVAIPCYQQGRYLRGAVESALNQKGIGCVLIIDNASTDDTLEIAGEFASRDSRVEVIAHSRNLGHHASFNEAIDWASADYFSILCADDLLAPGCLARAITVMAQWPNAHLTHGRSLQFRDGEPVPSAGFGSIDGAWQIQSGGRFLEALCGVGGRHQMSGATVIVRTSVQKRVGYYNRALTHTDDLEMWMRFAAAGDIASTDAIQAIGRVHPGMRTAAVGEALYAGLAWDLHLEKAFDRFFADRTPLMPLHRLAKRSLAERAYWGGASNLMRGNLRDGLDHLKFAFSRHPAAMLLPPVGYLMRRKGSVKRIATVLGSVARRKPLASPGL
jgi:glycosyltransferase involved in cell wall biosynthesis